MRRKNKNKNSKKKKKRECNKRIKAKGRKWQKVEQKKKKPKPKPVNNDKRGAKKEKIKKLLVVGGRKTMSKTHFPLFSCIFSPFCRD